ncbi:filamentous hemagglutinin N-terminal domain-containing protein [Arcobacter sp. FWKO B]|uniref:two-partner secretion domain-containing protein n=1 Tax=Arcobacter sp. FWKO B TaxID=2593672 RepID=UPI0018A3BF18|nr:filamentous hemagglutinin N-terminal domain-containing protein [Arcobacter sp. FWKO B]QOG11711.1 filamentous hemagglutinin N-terminal domain-containing protein [Arcobacter sp. FWKO B]
MTRFKCDFGSRFRILKGGKISLVVSALLGSTSLSFAAPTGGVVTSGNATISQNGNTTNIVQTTNKATINWNSFSIAPNETVNFNQPSINSITLNRIVGNEKSIIDGALNANGQVWILNSNGILFNSNAKINTAGLLATTKNITDTDFNAGNYKFSGNSTESVINMGTIDISDSGYVALLANTVQNDGTIKAHKGTVHLTGASEATINLNGNSIVNLTVDKGILDALVENQGAILADGGKIYLTTNAVDELLKGVVNNTGIIEAKSLDDISSEVILFAHGGTAKIGGTIHSKDGFVETSGRYFDFLGADIKAGEWLIDPVNITIDSTLATAIENGLASGNVKITTDTTDGTRLDTTTGESDTEDEGNINVNSAISWSSNHTLTLSAYNDINVNENITHTGTSAGGVIFLYGQGTANGGTSAYNLASGKTVVSPSIQWRKGSDLNSYRYAIVNNDLFIGNKYIELGISYSNGGKFGSSYTPSLFFGRQTPSGIGMVGDADGFGEGNDLRIDYFLPGSPAEQFTAGYGDYTTAAKNFASDINGYELLGLNDNNQLEMKLTSTVGDMKVEQTFTLGLSDKYFNNSVTLTNNGSSTITNPTFIRSFDPDNTVDMGGNYSTIQKIESTIVSDGAAAVSATSIAGDTYETTSGSQSKIIYYSTDKKATVGYGSVFFSGNSNAISTMITTANSLSKNDTATGDIGIGIIFQPDSLVASSSTTFNYLTSLDNRDMSTILSELNEVAIDSSTPQTSTPQQITNNNDNSIQKVITTIINSQQIKVDTPKIIQPVFTPTQTPFISVIQIPVSTLSTGVVSTPLANIALKLGVSQGDNVSVVSAPETGKQAEKITLAEIAQIKTNGNKENTQSSNIEVQETRVALGGGSLVELVNGGVSLPEGVDQEFYVVKSSLRGRN